MDRLAAVIDAIGSPHVCGFVRCLPYDPMNHMHDGPVKEVLQPWLRLADGRYDLRRFEPAWEQRLLAIASEYPHVLVNVSNESRAHLEWSRFWADTIRQRIPSGMMIGEMPSTNRRDGGGECEHAFSPMTLCTDPRYDYVDIAQGVSGHEFRTPREQALGGDMVLWGRFVGGAAAARFHRLAGNHPESVSQFQHEAVERLGRLIAQVPFWRMHPQPDLVTALPDGAGANVLADPDGPCVVQWIGGAAGQTLHMNLPSGTWVVRWIDPATGRELLHSKQSANAAGLKLKIPGDPEHRIIQLDRGWGQIWFTRQTAEFRVFG